MLRAVLLFGTLLATSSAASAEIFKCTAKNGLDLYQNFPCALDSLDALPAPAGKAAAPVKSIQAAPEPAPPAPARTPGSVPHVGMSAEEVRTLWGEPAEIVQDEPRSGRVEIWQYEDGRVVQMDQKRRVKSVQR